MPATIHIMMTVFSITTIAVFLYPIVKLTPSWLERSLQTKIAWHRAALAALATAMARTHNDPAQHARLAAQHDHHRHCLQALAPDTVIDTPLRSDIDAAA